jgi:hypothetical protein
MGASKNTKDIYRASVHYFINYINSLPLPEDLKSSLRLVSSEYSSYYLFYPHLFKDAFKVRQSDKIDILSIAGFLFYKSIIYIDKIVDEQVGKESVMEYFQLSLICQEESIKILATLFPLESPFWKLWNKRKGEYLLAQKSEKIHGYYSEEQHFFNLADNKAAFGKIAIDSLSLLEERCENNKHYDALLLSHRHFSIARQIYDDLVDIKEDYQNKQSNYALFNLLKACEKDGINMKELNEEYLEKYLYVMGVSEILLNQVISHFEKALSSTQPYLSDNSLWIETIKVHIYLARKKQIRQVAYLKQLRAKLDFSYTFLKKTAKLDKTEIDERKNLALQYLGSKLTTEGYWEEYINSAGVSNIWATAFIYSFVASIPHIQKYIQIDKVKNFLLTKSLNGFSYNDIAPRDGDSTNFGLLALYCMDVNLSNNVGSLIEYQNSNGGFSTYSANDRNPLRKLMNFHDVADFGAWEESHMCVSAVSLYLLSQIRHGFNLEEIYQHVKSYILKNQVKSSWPSYWWTSHLYATSFIVKAAFKSNDDDLQLASIPAIKEINHTQNSNGSFGDKFLSESAFYTGLVSDALSSTPKLYTSNSSRVKKSIEWIINNQFDDGSWNETNAMRLPSFNTKNPDEISAWPVSRSGLNVRAIEFNRLFSTATCISALNSYGLVEF